MLDLPPQIRHSLRAAAWPSLHDFDVKFSSDSYAGTVLNIIKCGEVSSDDRVESVAQQLWDRIEVVDPVAISEAMSRRVLEVWRQSLKE